MLQALAGNKLITEGDYVTLHMQLPGHEDQLPEMRLRGEATCRKLLLISPFLLRTSTEHQLIGV
jgi:hypothetical protein